MYASFGLSVIIPERRDVCITDVIWNVLASRIRFEIASVESRISRAATRPPPIFLHSTCDTTPFNDSESITRICSWRSAGN
jgi:hypothetical protein